MSIRVNIPPFLSHLSNNMKTVDVIGNTVGDCLIDVVRQFPQLKEWVFDKNGRVQKYIEILVNGESAYPEELTKSVKDGDEIYIFNIIAGG